MTDPSGQEQLRLARRAASWMQILSVLMAVVEVLRIAIESGAGDVAFGVVATVLFLPLHVQHLRFGLRGQRPPRAALTLSAMVVIHVAALVVIGLPWAFMLATLAVSILIVVPVPWSLPLLALCYLGPAIVSAVAPAPEVGPVSYLCYSVLFRSLIQFAIVWLVAAAHQLAQARTALAEEQGVEERFRLQSEVRVALGERLEVLAQMARRAYETFGRVGAATESSLIRVGQVSDEALANLRQIVAHGGLSAGATARVALNRSADDAKSPVGLALVGRRARLSCALVIAVTAGFLAIANLADWRGVDGYGGPLLFVGWAATVGLLAWLAAGVAKGERRSGGPVWVLVLGAGAVVMVAINPGAWAGIEWFFGAAGLLLLRGRWRLVAVLAALAITVTPIALNPYPAVGSFGQLALNLWAGFYYVAIDLLAILGIYGSARLLALVAGLERTRAALAIGAVESERRRMTGDLHDVFGQSLTAISLKSELARRLISRDPRRAKAELEELQALATSQADELEAVSRGERRVDFEREARDAVSLLRAAGIEVSAVIEVADLDEEMSTLLGWAVREGVTNVLRHARARHCKILAVRLAGQVRLELRNDGVADAPGSPGTGLRSLSDRLSGASGEVRATRGSDGTFSLEVELPELVPA